MAKEEASNGRDSKNKAENIINGITIINLADVILIPKPQQHNKENIKKVTKTAKIKFHSTAT